MVKMFVYGEVTKEYGSDRNEYAVPMTENQAKEKLMMYDIAAYEQLFGELEEA